MISTLFVILFVVWVLGMLSAYSLGGFVHLPLALAIALAALNFAAQKRTTA